MISPVAGPAPWQDFVGRTHEAEELLAPETARRFAAATGASLDVEREPPPLVHWAFFLETRAATGLGEDGHPRRGGFLPPVTLPRRMFAAAELRFHRPVRLGAPGLLRSTITDIRHRRGQAGDLVFVDVRRSLSQDGKERLTEKQTIVYREIGPAQEPVVVRTDPDGGEQWLPRPVDLFRFSAATFNSHRIHYDLLYAREVDLYPDLVVHGPLTAARLYAVAASQRAWASVRGFAFRTTAPLFVGQHVTLRRGKAHGSVEAVRCDGITAMTATASFLEGSEP